MLGVITILGAVAVLLSSIGLAGLAGYTVAQRTREIGLRLALGAGNRQIVHAILAPMARPIAVGFSCGALGGSVVVKILSAGISGIASLHSFDPLADAAALSFFIAVVGVACSHPIFRAIHTNPSEALQYE
jgi:ABC-type antimicrobial peptide transport system permease subunit